MLVLKYTIKIILKHFTVINQEQHNFARKKERAVFALGLQRGKKICCYWLQSGCVLHVWFLGNDRQATVFKNVYVWYVKPNCTCQFCNFSTLFKKIIRLWWRPGNWEEKLLCHVAMVAKLLGRVVQSWVKITLVSFAGGALRDEWRP